MSKVQKSFAEQRPPARLVGDDEANEIDENEETQYTIFFKEPGVPPSQKQSVPRSRHVANNVSFTTATITTTTTTAAATADQYTNGAGRGSNPSRRRPVHILSAENEILQTCGSCTEASRVSGVDQSSIIKCCKGRVRTAGGKFFRYADTEAEATVDADGVGNGQDEGTNEATTGTPRNNLRNNSQDADSNALKGISYSDLYDTKPSSGLRGALSTGYRAMPVPITVDNASIPTLGAMSTKANGMKAINCFDMDGKYVKTFISQAEAAKELGVCGPSISNCCLGKRRSCGGYVFRFVDSADAVSK